MRDLYERDEVQKAMLQSRRNFILKSGAGFAALPLASILGRDGFLNPKPLLSKVLLDYKTLPRTFLKKQSIVCSCS